MAMGSHGSNPLCLFPCFRSGDTVGGAPYKWGMNVDHLGEPIYGYTAVSALEISKTEYLKRWISEVHRCPAHPTRLALNRASRLCAGRRQEHQHGGDLL